MLRTISTLALAGCAAAALNGSALAQDKVTLKFADWMSLSHYTVSHAAVPFMDKVRELSGGNIEILHFPAEQLGKAKDALSLVQSGVADIANISPSYIPDKFVISGGILPTGRLSLGMKRQGIFNVENLHVIPSQSWRVGRGVPVLLAHRTRFVHQGAPRSASLHPEPSVFVERQMAAL